MGVINRQDAIEVIQNLYIRNLYSAVPQKCADAYNLAIAQVSEAIESLPSAQRWIPCSESVPDKLNAVLMTDYDNWIDIGYYVKGYGWHYRDLVGTPNILAWMPLPEPYKEGPDD